MTAINEVKLLIDEQVKCFGKSNKVTFPENRFSPAYLWTNEEVSKTLDLVDLKKYNNALCVASSGDHAFNLIYKGILNIDTFDINGLAEYIALGLKRSMILKYNYHEFINISNKLSDFKTNPSIINEIILALLPYMEEKHRIFWQFIIDYNDKLSLKKHIIFYILVNGYGNFFKAMFCNNYLLGEFEYNILRRRIEKANISFTRLNIVDISNTLKNQYDIIILSNILDYFDYNFGRNWDYQKLQEFESNLEKITSSKGIMLLHYIYYVFYPGMPVISNSKIEYNDLVTEEVLELPSSNDGVILKRVR